MMRRTGQSWTSRPLMDRPKTQTQTEPQIIPFKAPAAGRFSHNNGGCSWGNTVEREAPEVGLEGEDGLLRVLISHERIDRPEYKSMENPYNSTWSLRILEQYYNITCRNTGHTDTVGMPVFKIRKIHKHLFESTGRRDKASGRNSKADVPNAGTEGKRGENEDEAMDDLVPPQRREVEDEEE